MSEIRVTVTDQVLAIEDAPVIASGGVQENTVRFTFDSAWSGMTKVAVFYQDSEHVYRQIVDSQNRCVVPKEATAEAKAMYFGVFGAKGDTILTSEVLRYKIVRGAVTKDTSPSDPTPDIYQQILQIYNSLKTDFNALLSELGNKSTISTSRGITTFWKALEYMTKYMDTDLRQLLNTAIANSSTQGVIDLINNSVLSAIQRIPLSPIKSIQRGVLGPGAALTVTHSSVDINKSIILLNGSMKGNASYDYSPIITQRTSTSFTLKPSYFTGLTSVQTDSNGASWQLIEFN